MKMSKMTLILISLLILMIGIGCIYATNLDDVSDNGAIDYQAGNWYPIIAGTLGGGMSNGLGSSNPNSGSDSLEAVNPEGPLQAVNPDEPLQLNDKPASTIGGALEGDYSVNLAGDKAASTWDIDFDHSNPYFPPIIDSYDPLNPFNPNPDSILQ